MVEVKGINFEVIIEKKHIKNIYLRLEGNVIHASCPYYVPNYEVYKFIESKKNWIYKVYIYNMNKPKNIYLYRGGDIFYIFGEEYKMGLNVIQEFVSVANKRKDFGWLL